MSRFWVVLVIGIVATLARAEQSAWVYPGPDGKLVYKATERGDRIMDFSHAGYMGGGVALPDVPVKRSIKPSGTDDDVTGIQAAIDEVAKLPLVDGFRGAVLLEPGTFVSPRAVTIAASGVVLRGSGSGAGGTTLKMVGQRHAAFVISRGRQQQQPGGGDTEPATQERRQPGGVETSIADAYVPAGTNRFAVADAKGFAVGDTIAIRRPTTAAWVQFMQMHTLKRNGNPQTWIGLSRGAVSERKITAIDEDRITVDIPLSDSFDAKHLNPPGATVSKVSRLPGSGVTNVGIERLHLQCPPLETSYGQAPYSAVRVAGDDCWVRDVYCEELMNATTITGRRVTMQQVVVKHTYPNLGASKPTDFSLEGSQILVDRCRITGDNMYFVWTGSLNTGPNVVLNSTFSGRGSRIQPHQRWSTGLLADNCTVPDGGIDFPNRGVAGSGHGWTMGWGVAWNCVANFYVIQQPPGTYNWAIGCVGVRVKTARYFDTSPILSEGEFDSHSTPVAPQSLYLAQLQERLGPQALKNIGYGSNSVGMFAESKATQRLSELKGEVDPQLGPDLAFHRPVNAAGGRGVGRETAAEKALDGDDKTYWSVNDRARGITFEVDMEGPVEINALQIAEMPGVGGAVREYRVEGQVDSDWKLLSQGTTLDGGRKIDRFPKTTVWKVKLTILKADPNTGIRKFGLYSVPE